MVDGCPATQRTSQTVQPETPRCWPDIYKHPSLKRRCISRDRYHETHRTTSLHCRDILLDGMLIKCHPTSATAGGRGHPYCHQRACSPDVHTTIDTDVDTTTTTVDTTTSARLFPRRPHHYRYRRRHHHLLPPARLFPRRPHHYRYRRRHHHLLPPARLFPRHLHHYRTTRSSSTRPV